MIPMMPLMISYENLLSALNSNSVTMVLGLQANLGGVEILSDQSLKSTVRMLNIQCPQIPKYSELERCNNERMNLSIEIKLK